MSEFLETYNTGNSSSMAQFAHANGIESGLMGHLYSEFGPLRRRLEFEGAHWCQGQVTMGWVGFVLQRTPEDTGFYIRGIRRGVNPPGSWRFAPTGVDWPTYLANYLRGSAANGFFSGSVAVAKNGRVIFSDAFGLADRTSGVKNTTRTKFWLASLSKPLVGTAVGQLVERGKLRFDDPIIKYIPEYPSIIGKQVTIHHLLTHTSGIELDHDRRFMVAVADSKSLEEVLSAHVTHITSLRTFDGHRFQPLTRFDYTNEGLDLLGIIIERVSGKPWDVQMNDAIFNPCSMKSSGVASISDAVDDLAKCYTLGPSDQLAANNGRKEVLPSARRGTAVAGPARPAGSIYSTCEDLIRFAQGLVEHSIINEQTWAIMTKPHIDEPSLGATRRHYGYLLQIQEQAGLRTIGHSGGAAGMSAILDIYPDDEVIVAVLSNYDKSAARNVSEHIKELVLLQRHEENS